MKRNGFRVLCILAATALLLTAAVLPDMNRLPMAWAEQLTTPTDLTTAPPAPEETEAPTEAPAKGKRSGYALINAGATIWKSRKRDSSLGKVGNAAIVWIPTTSVDALTYKVRFDTELSVGLDECHTAYVLFREVTWLTDAEQKELKKELEADKVRQSGGVWIPAIDFAYRNPPKTPVPTATPELTATPEPTAMPELTATPEPVITATPAPEATAAPQITPAPVHTPEADVATGTDLEVPVTAAPPADDLTTPTDLHTPVPSVPAVTPEVTPAPEDGYAEDTDLITPAPEETILPVITAVPPMADEQQPPEPTADIATGTDLPAPETLTAAEMEARLDETHPNRRLTLYYDCADDGFAVGATVMLWAEVTGYDGLDYTVVWEVNRGDGWENAGADGMQSLAFVISEENINWGWRAGVRLAPIERE